MLDVPVPVVKGESDRGLTLVLVTARSPRRCVPHRRREPHACRARSVGAPEGGDTQEAKHQEATVGWLDISVPVHDRIATFPGDPAVARTLHASIAEGAIVNVSRVDLGAHTGTHIDAPCHFIDGAASVEDTPLDAVIGPAWVVDARGLTATITAPDLDAVGIPAGETRLLFRTRNSELWALPHFSPEFIGLGADAAEALIRRGTRLVGIDYLSIAPYGDPVATHQALLGAGVVVLEGVDLRRIEPGPYELLAAPVRWEGADGAPARALLRPRDGAG
jgi:arylformamidase